jgi:hypothetical protein
VMCPAWIAERWIVDRETGCWIWQLSRIASGYGHMRHNGRWALAHRVLYEEQKGPIPEGLTLDHLCRNRACVNPAHLEPVTNAENARRGANAKLTAEQAAEIRQSVEPVRVLTGRFGVSRSTVYMIRQGKRWVT